MAGEAELRPQHLEAISLIRGSQCVPHCAAPGCRTVCSSKERRGSCLGIHSGLLAKCYMYIRLISALCISKHPLKAVPFCIPARMTDFSGQVLNLMLFSATHAAAPHGAFQGLMDNSPLNLKLMCIALHLQLFLGMLNLCVSMVSLVLCLNACTNSLKSCQTWKTVSN